MKHGQLIIINSSVSFQNEAGEIIWQKGCPTLKEWNSLWPLAQIDENSLKKGTYRYLQHQSSTVVIVVFTPLNSGDSNIHFDINTGIINAISEAR